jgi:hypothetical protein
MGGIAEGGIMFGMLDYRAHKLYKVLVYPVTFVIGLFNIICLPILSYIIAMQLSQDRVVQLIAAVIIFFLIGIPWFFVIKMLVAVPVGIFNFLVDPVPAEGRTKEQAQVVVHAGQKGVTLLTFDRPAIEWTDEAIESLSRITMTSRIFQREIRTRVYALRDYYLEHPELAPNRYTSDKFLKENQMKMGWAETAITNPFWRSVILQHLTLLAMFLATVP